MDLWRSVMADWESKPQGPSLNQTREIGYVVIKNKKRHRAKLYKPSVFSTSHMLKFHCYEFCNRLRLSNTNSIKTNDFTELVV